MKNKESNRKDVMNRLFAPLMFCLCLGWLTGCYTADSGNYATDQIVFDFGVEVSETVATATASFWTYRAIPGTPVYLVLTHFDAIMVNGITMSRKRGPIADYYSVTIPPAEQYTFTFTRGDGTSYDSTVDTIPPLVITSPEAETWISRAADLDVAWTNPVEDGVVTVYVPRGEYVNGFLQQVVDSGTYTIPAGTFLLDASAPTASFEAMLYVSRKKRENLGPELAGAIEVRTGDSVRFITTE